MAIGTFVKNVAAAGTQEPLRPSTLLVNRFAVRAKDTNTQKVYVGGSDVDSSIGFPLVAGESKEFGPQSNTNSRNLAAYWVDADVNGEGVVVEYEQV